jgi:glycosyltransferase involved in cell wall biosynthesis
VAEAISDAACIICLNPADAECIAGLRGNDRHIHHLAPFIDTEPSATAAGRREALRDELVRSLGIAPSTPWIATTAMMRMGDKLASYRLLGRALRNIQELPWILLVAGDGEARTEIEQALDFPGRVRYLGRQDREGLDRLHAAADIGAWPAINEAFGMALLEAQAAGLPLVAGGRPGVRQIVRENETGLLTPEGDAEAFAQAIAGLLAAPDRRMKMRKKALEITSCEHNLKLASKSLDRILRQAARKAA